MGSLFQDLSYGIRMLLKSPSVTAISTLALALGIGATTAIFSVINSVLIHPLGPANTDRLVTIYSTDPKGTAGQPAQGDYFDWRDQAASFDQMEAWGARRFTLTGLEKPSLILAQRVSLNFFDALGLKPFLGRPFSEEDFQSSTPNVIILTHRFWMNYMGGDQDALGKTLKLDTGIYTVIGVMQPGDVQLFANLRPDLWIPLQLDADEKSMRQGQFLGVLARLKPGIELQQAQEEMNIISARLASQYPESNEGVGAKVSFAADDLVGDIRPTLLVLLGAVMFVLLIACANVANLQLTRAVSRQKEMAIRLALGASRRRLIRQLLTESLLLGAIGGILGTLLAYWSINPLVALIPETSSFVGIGNIGIDRWVLGFTLLATVLTSVIFGLVPAMQSSRLNLNEHLKEADRGTTSGVRARRFRGLLVMAEFTLALVLLVGAGLMIQSFQRLQNVDPGFEHDNLLTMVLSLPRHRYTPDKGFAFFRELTDRVAALPGVNSVSLTSNVRLRSEIFAPGFAVEGTPASPPDLQPRASLLLVTPEYFQTMRIPLLSGRNFTDQDVKGSGGVVVISSKMARQHWPGEDPVGKRIRVDVLSIMFKSSPSDLTVIGVVGDVRLKGLAAEPEPAMYVAYAQYQRPALTLVVRTGASPQNLTTAVQQQVWSIDKDLAIVDTVTMDRVISDSIWQLRFSMTLLIIFAATALLLAACGVYAVISYSVRQRTHEIGVRMALGAGRGSVLKLVLLHGLKMSLGGIAIGLLMAFILNRALSNWLYGVGDQTQTLNRWLPAGQRVLLYGLDATDPVTFAAIGALLMATGLLASYIPARRASQVDPMIALRHE
jgi:putative ABC transport system permease protein